MGFHPINLGSNPSKNNKMFNTLYRYWSNVNDSPSILFKLNLWTYVNIRFFKFRFSRNILYFIQGLNGMRLNSITYFYKDWIFEDFYYRFAKYFFILIIILLVI